MYFWDNWALDHKQKVTITFMKLNFTFNFFFQEEVYVAGTWSFLSEVVLTIKEGLRLGEGISGALEDPDVTNPNYYQRYLII